MEAVSDHLPVFTHEPSPTWHRGPSVPLCRELIADTHDQCQRCGTWHPILLGGAKRCDCVPITSG